MRIAYTITSNSYVQFTKIAVDSFLEFNTDFIFYIFHIDEIKFQESVNKNSILYFNVHDIGLQEFSKLRDKYQDFELCNALKPFLGDWLINEIPDLRTLIYLDSDIQFFGKIDLAEFVNYNIVLTPHITSEIPLDNHLITEKEILNTGIYNAGFILMNICPAVSKFLNWWKKRTLNYCYIDLVNGLFVDQIWLNLVPLYFDNVHITRNLGYNMAHWNLHERFLTYDNNVFYVNKKYKLIFFHFSGFDEDNFNQISKYQTRYNLSERTDLQEIFKAYFTQIRTEVNYNDFTDESKVVFKTRKSSILNNILNRLKN